VARAAILVEEVSPVIKEGGSRAMFSDAALDAFHQENILVIGATIIITAISSPPDLPGPI